VRLLRKQAIFTKRVVLDEIFIFRYSVMPEYQLIEKSENIARRNFFDFVCFRSGLASSLSGSKHVTTRYHAGRTDTCDLYVNFLCWKNDIFSSTKQVIFR